MPHLAEDAAVGAGDALHCQDGAVGVVAQVHARPAVEVDVLRGYLPVFNELLEQLGLADEAALAVGDGHGVYVADGALAQPGAEVRAHARAHEPALVAADSVVCERRAAAVRLHDAAEGHEAELYKRLEAVADAQREAVALVKQLVDGVGELFAAEEGVDEFAAPVRLVAAGEAAGYDQHLAAAQGLDHALKALLDVLGAEVAEDEYLRLRPGAAEGPRGVELAVGAGEDGDERARARRARQGRGAALRLIAQGVELPGALLGAAQVRIDALKPRLPGELHIGHVHALARGEGVVLRDGAERFTRGAVGRELEDEAAEAPAEEAALVKGGVEPEAQAVAEAHLAKALGYAAAARGPGGAHLPGAHQGLNLLPEGERGRGVEGVGAHEGDAAAGRLELGAHGVRDLPRLDGEGDERGRHVKLLKAAGHGVLAAYRARAEGQLGVQRAEQGGEGLAPALGSRAQALEILLEAQIHVLVPEAARHQARDALRDGEVGPAVGVLLAELHLEAPAHGGAACGLAHDGDFRRHALGGRELIGSAEGHEDRARANC